MTVNGLERMLKEKRDFSTESSPTSNSDSSARHLTFYASLCRHSYDDQRQERHLQTTVHRHSSMNGFHRRVDATQYLSRSSTLTAAYMTGRQTQMPMVEMRAIDLAVIS